MIAALPAFHLLTDVIDDREAALDAVGAGKRLAYFYWQTEFRDGEAFLQSLHEAGRGTRIRLQQLVMKLVEQVARVRSLRGAIRHPHSVLQRGAIRVRDMFRHIPDLVHLAALHERRISGVTPDRGANRFAAIDDVQSRLAEVQPSFHQVAQQGAHHGCIFRRALPQTQYQLTSRGVDAYGDD